MNPFEIAFYYFLTYLPAILLLFSIYMAVYYYFSIKRKKFELGVERGLFEIKIPKEIVKTPLAMELVLSSIYNGSAESDGYDNLQGKRRAVFSLEIVSVGGQVRFYIGAPKAFRKIIESAFYAQYPTIQIEEVVDYTKFFDLDLNRDIMTGFEYGLTKPDPLPIKTYKEFGLDKSGVDPEELTDPMNNIIETFSNIGPDEKMWMQIVIKAQKKEHKLGFLSPKKAGEEQKIRKMGDGSSEAKKIIEEFVTGPDGERRKVELEHEKEFVDAIARNISKLSFGTGIRSVYFAPKKRFEGASAIALKNIFQPIQSQYLNGIKQKFGVTVDFPGNDYKKIFSNRVRIKMFADYKRRYFFRPEGKERVRLFGIFPILETRERYHKFILSTEELATIYHPPSTTVSEPSFERDELKKGKAPVNLPI